MDSVSTGGPDSGSIPWTATAQKRPDTGSVPWTASAQGGLTQDVCVPDPVTMGSNPTGVPDPVTMGATLQECLIQ